jgi:hypothetical protein
LKKKATVMWEGFRFHQSAWVALRESRPKPGERWNSAYTDIVDALFAFRVRETSNPLYLILEGWDEHLQFDEHQLPSNCDTIHQLYITETDWPSDSAYCCTWQFAEDCFISVAESGDFIGIVNIWWQDALGNEERIIERLVDKMRDKLHAY